MDKLEELLEEMRTHKSTDKLKNQLEALSKVMDAADPVIKLTEALRDAAALITFAEMAKAYGADADKFIDKAIKLWETQLRITFQALEVMALATQDEDFTKFTAQTKTEMQARQDKVAAAFRRQIHELMEDKMPELDLPMVNFTGTKPPEC